MATVGLAGCYSSPEQAAAPAAAGPGAGTPVVAACTSFTSMPVAAVPAGAYSAADSEALNSNLYTIPSVKPSLGGALQVKKINCMPTLTDVDGKPIQLRGMSTGGLQWFPASVNSNAFAALAGGWGSNVVRLAMYVGEGGYATTPAVYDTLIKGIDLAIANDMYVIVDWHVLTPGDPNDATYAGASDFFKKVAAKYPNDAHLIYELANEPNAGAPGVSNDAAGWAKVKSYATPIISMLRAAGNKNLVIVGTPSWSQRPDLAADNPIDDTNVMYAVHFYSGSHAGSNSATDHANVMSNARYALEHNAGIFVTESGVSQASGTGGTFLKEADQWISFLNKHNVSWVNWALTNKNETSAAFAPTTSLDPGGDKKWAPNELTTSGDWAQHRILGTPLLPVDKNAFDSTISDFDDGTLQGWVSDHPAVTLSNENGLLKVSGMKTSSDTSDNFWGNTRISADGGKIHPDASGVKTMTADVYVDGDPSLVTIAFAAVPQSSKYSWSNPAHAVVVKGNQAGIFAKTASGKYKARLTITIADAPNMGLISTDATSAGHDLQNVIMYIGASGTDTFYIDNVTFSGTHPVTP